MLGMLSSVPPASAASPRAGSPGDTFSAQRGQMIFPAHQSLGRDNPALPTQPFLFTCVYAKRSYS